MGSAYSILVKRISKGIQKGNSEKRRTAGEDCATLEKLSKEPFRPYLKTHKLHGKLAGLWACEVKYDCRIVFAFEKDPETGGEVIVLADIGRHDEVY